MRKLVDLAGQAKSSKWMKNMLIQTYGLGGAGGEWVMVRWSRDWKEYYDEILISVKQVCTYAQYATHLSVLRTIVI